jgi:hypothetical protein
LDSQSLWLYDTFCSFIGRVSEYWSTVESISRSMTITPQRIQLLKYVSVARVDNACKIMGLHPRHVWTTSVFGKAIKISLEHAFGSF